MFFNGACWNLCFFDQQFLVIGMGEGIGSYLNESRNACITIIIDDFALVFQNIPCVQRHDIPKRNGRHGIGTMQSIQTRKQVNTPLIIEKAPNE